MRKAFRKLLIVLLGLLLLQQPLQAFSGGYEAKECAANAGYDDVQSWLSGALTETAGTGSDWYVFALRKCDPTLDYSAFRAALAAAFSESASVSAATRLRMGLLLAELGEPVDAGALLAETETQGGVMTRVFGLHLRRAAGLDGAAEAEALVALQFPDGGWAVMGSVSDADVTAMVLQALAPYPAASDAIRRGLARLAQLQLEDGGFAGFGPPNAETCAQVVLALCALDLDPDTCFANGSVSDALRAYRRTDGGFSHVKGGEPNAVADAQAFMALTALRVGGSLYDVPPLSPRAARVPLGYKTWGTIALGAAALIACVLLLAFRRRRDCVLVLAICALLVGGLWLTDFRTADARRDPAEPAEITGTAVLSVTRGPLGLDPILPETEVGVGEGETVYTLLSRVAGKKEIALSVRGVTAASSAGAYVSGIGGLFELDEGPLSGWIYLVNGEQPSLGCGACPVRDGDRVEWCYTLDLGHDVGPDAQR